MATLAGSATLKPAVSLVAMPQSLFSILQTVMDAHIWNPTLRTEALTALIAYHAATSFPDKLSAENAIDQAHDDALCLLDNMWGMFSGGIYGVFTVPSNHAAVNVASEVASVTATSRATKSLPPLKVKN